MSYQQDEKTLNAFKPRSWNDVKTDDAWRIFKIMSEFVDGFEMLSRIGPCVSIFGSARTKENERYYELAREIAYKLSQWGYGIITGGGPGIMEAGNRGAQEAKGSSVGLNIELPFEQTHNKFIDADKLKTFDHFYVRKTMFVKYAQGFVVMPGGYGTLDEFFEAVTLIQTEKIGRFPIILVGSEFWQGLIEWMERVLCDQYHYISDGDTGLFEIADTADEVVSCINRFYSKYLLRPNF
ncbi:MAG: TIGR00730 family Rossman fold protein [Bacteroidales bacterium]|nr:TIGR00730 family Rossman fold protein [Bacteroidales bacterium]